MGEAKKTDWIRVAYHINEIDFAANSIAVMKVKGKTICLGRKGEEVFAFAHKCPHASGIMADGFIDALGYITCPLHRYKFDIRNGRNVSGEGYYLKTWPVLQKEDGVYVGMEPSHGFRDIFG